MLDRDACERRVYRLATLLSGDPTIALRVVAEVVNARLDPRELDSIHLDRLTVLRSRELAPASSSRMLLDERLPEPVAKAWASLTHQQRETWVFRRVYGLEDRDVARSMDCSTTAASRHLDQADAVMRGRGGLSPEQAAERLLEFSLGLDLPVHFRRRLRRRARWRRLLIWLGAAIAIAVVAAALLLARESLLGGAGTPEPAPEVADPDP